MRVPEQLRIFTVLSIVYSFFFFYVMYNYMHGQCWWVFALVALAYVVLMLFSAVSLARAADASGMKTNKPFAFHLSAYLTMNIVHALFFVFNWVSAGATLKSVFYTALIWGVLLVLHGYIVGRKPEKQDPDIV